MNTAEIEKMSKVEKLQTMEAIWDSFSHEKTKIESPAWHKDILLERKKIIDAGIAEFTSLEEMKAKYNK